MKDQLPRERGGGGRKATTLVVCYGNPLRSDDGVGWEVARLLAAAAPPLPPNVEIRTVQQLDPAMAEDLAGASYAIFVDAEPHSEPAAVRLERVRPEVVAGLRANVHTATPNDLLSLARRLYGKAPDALLVAVPAYLFDHGESLSDNARAAAKRAAQLIHKVLAHRPCPGPGSPG